MHDSSHKRPMFSYSIAVSFAMAVCRRLLSFQCQHEVDLLQIEVQAAADGSYRRFKVDFIPRTVMKLDSHSFWQRGKKVMPSAHDRDQAGHKRKDEPQK